MGRRATSTTKGGRFMNPADQHRKQERKKELKKNKKQRVQVRQAVLKAKDPEDIIEQMSRLDQMVFDPHYPPPLPETVIDEKRTKLRQTYLRVMGMYKREDEPEKANELQKALRDYDQQRKTMEQNFMAVKFANTADPDEIPLPMGSALPGAALTPAIPASSSHHIPFPSHMLLPEATGPGILKHKRAAKSDVPPGPPSGAPPELSDDESDEEEGADDDEHDNNDKDTHVASKVRFADVPDEDEKDSRSKFKQLAKKRAEGSTDEQQLIEEGEEMDVGPGPMGAPPPGAFNPSVFPPMPPPGIRPRLLRPPPPPMGMPPGFMPGMPMGAGFRPGGPMRPGAIGPQGVPTAAPGANVPAPTSAAVISAAPTVLKRSSAPGATIEAKPQMRNLKKEVTRLVPTAVKVRREGQVSKPSKPRVPGSAAASGYASGSTPAAGSTKPTADDAYAQFLNEMKGLL